MLFLEQLEGMCTTKTAFQVKITAVTRVCFDLIQIESCARIVVCYWRRHELLCTLTIVAIVALSLSADVYPAMHDMHLV